MEDKRLLFVLRNYRAGWLDIKSARRQLEYRIPGLRRSRMLGVMRRCAGAVVAAALCIGVVLHQVNRPRTYMAYDVAQSFTLPDSSVVTLAPWATLSLRPHGFDRFRRVKMTGKVFFSVHRDEKSPFEVNADGSFVRVLGTRFQVNRTDTGTVVDVLSGKVLFSRKRDDATGLILSRGMSAALTKTSDTPALTRSETLNPMAWATGKFIYSNAPLSRVLSELSELWHCALTVEEGVAEGRFLTGEFDASDMDKTIRLIDNALDVKIVVR